MFMGKNEQENTEEQYILDENQEFSLGENPLVNTFFKAFPALSHRNYQLYFGGQLISFSGTWLQMVAQGWLVEQLTHSAFWVGVINALSMLPILFFSLIAGVIVDRFPKKKIIFFCEGSNMVFSFFLGTLIYFNAINLVMLSVFVFLMGIINSLDMPARQAFAVEMVGKDKLSSAIALNSGVFNGTRVIGPALAGYLIALYGTSGAYLINAASFIAVLIAIYYIKPLGVSTKVHPHPVEAIKEGLRYSMANSKIKILLLTACVYSVFGWSYGTLLPVITEKVYHQGAAGLGHLYTAIGVGSIIGIVTVSALLKKHSSTYIIPGSGLLFSLALFLFTLTTNFFLALCCLCFVGAGLIVLFSLLNSEIQHLVTDNIRGRVMSIYSLVFLGFMPFGNFAVGFIADRLGSFVALRICAIILLVFGIFLLILFKKKRFD
jgi:predicted MFS family arabinose efflux permease